MDKDFCQVKSQGRQSWDQGSGYQTLGPWCFSLLLVASYHLTTESGVDELPPLSLGAFPEESPFPDLRKKKLMALMTMAPAKRHKERI